MGNYGPFLIMGNAGCISPTVCMQGNLSFRVVGVMEQLMPQSITERLQGVGFCIHTAMRGFSDGSWTSGLEVCSAFCGEITYRYLLYCAIFWFESLAAYGPAL